ncbi:DUF1570 domain-containing protein [Rhodopirellula sallentina]|uniref:Secreted protein containing DUF1570 n=1 Tax=Rhodopirellula sallentina SM41 TaxID=1263870 RepID=M5U3C2_9BACT|nr:DUF1570 domain-containing protein [Rhodopirellula sallentina]EMI55955.1 secreted protein containing DUF1570 [Rhodopirellula sallentina SM41]
MHRSVNYLVLVVAMGLLHNVFLPTVAAQFNPLAGLRERLEDQRRRIEQSMQKMEENSREMQDRLRNTPMMPMSGGGLPAGALIEQSPAESGGLRLTPGPIRHSHDERVLVRDADGATVVGRLHVGIGSTNVVLMPDGSLKSYPAEQTQPTEKPFQPLTMDELEAKLLADPKLAGFESIRSRRFLYLYNSSELFIRSSRNILESMYPAVRRYFERSGIDVHEPELPLVVIAFSTDEEFQEYRRMPYGVVAYYDSETNASLIYERSALSTHAPEIAVKNAISTIAHEGAHQILHNIGVQQRLSRWPLWLSEGLAEFYAPTSVQKGIRWSGLGSANQLRMMEISNDWEKRKPNASGNTVRRITASDDLDSLDYAYAWGLIHTLSRRHQKELFACVLDCSKRRPLEGIAALSDGFDSPSEVFTKHFGDDYASVEKEMNRHLLSLKYVDPVKNQTYYLVVAGSSVMLTSSPDKVKELQRTYRGRCQVRTFPNRALGERAMAAITR